MGGPGVDPHYNGTSAEASGWGRAAGGADAERHRETAPQHLPGRLGRHRAARRRTRLRQRLEQRLHLAVQRRGEGVLRPGHLWTGADFNGFAAYITAHSSYKVGVYSSAGIWTSIFGTGSAASIPDTYEWTYEPETTDFATPRTAGACPPAGARSSSAARAHSSRYALMWQWSGGGGVSNGVGDFDQIDSARQG